MGRLEGGGLRQWLRSHPRFYDLAFRLFSPVLVTGPRARDVLAREVEQGRVLDLGSANQRRHEDFTNIDIVPYDEVDVVASLSDIPLEDGSATGACCLVTLEHVPDVDRVLEETHRVLRRGGKLFVAVPFLQPYHASPDDFWRWSHRGLEQELSKHGFHVSSTGIYCGPASALAWGVASVFGHVLSLGSERVRGWLDLPLQALFSPIKWFDLILARLPGSIRAASAIYAIAIKK